MLAAAPACPSARAHAHEQQPPAGEQAEELLRAASLPAAPCAGADSEASDVASDVESEDEQVQQCGRDQRRAPTRRVVCVADNKISDNVKQQLRDASGNRGAIKV